MNLDIEGNSVLITGGSKGIGLATARAFVEERCILHLAARTVDDLLAAQEGITKDFDVPVTIHPIDLSQGTNVKQLAKTCGDADILVNNAGAVPGGSIEVIDEEQWRTAWDLKPYGYINMMREYYSAMKTRGRGVIINIIGNAGNLTPADIVAGVTADAMLELLTRTLGGACFDYGIRVVGVTPGDIMNERGILFLRQQAEKELGDLERWRERLVELPGGRGGTSKEIADAVVFLASPRASYISRAVLTIDGGLSARRAVM